MVPGTTLKKINYGVDTANSRPYFLEFMYAEDGEMVSRVEETFETKAEFLERIEGIVPIFEEGE